MKATILYHPQSEPARAVEEYVRDFRVQTGKTIDLLSVDTREGADLAALYDVVQYPALLVQQDNGDLVKFWQDVRLPLMNEVAGYMNS